MALMGFRGDILGGSDETQVVVFVDIGQFLELVDKLMAICRGVGNSFPDNLSGVECERERVGPCVDGVGRYFAPFGDRCADVFPEIAEIELLLFNRGCARLGQDMARRRSCKCRL